MGFNLFFFLLDAERLTQDNNVETDEQDANAETDEQELGVYIFTYCFIASDHMWM